MKNEGCPFIVIYDWMYTLNLSGKELLVFALIHGYSREDGVWFDSKKRIAERLRIQPSGVSRALRVLIGMGLITEVYYQEGGSTLSAEFDDSGLFIIVYDWMFTLNLSGRELLVFALIYGFNQEGKDCFGRREWIARRLKITNLSKVIASLKKKGLVWEKLKPDKSPILIPALSRIDPLTAQYFDGYLSN